jgi:hypothetical protein
MHHGAVLDGAAHRDIECFSPWLQALYQGLEQLAGRMEVQLEMHVNEAPFARSFILSDCDLARVGAASGFRGFCCFPCLYLCGRQPEGQPSRRRDAGAVAAAPTEIHAVQQLVVLCRGLTVCSSPAEACRQSCGWSSSLPALQRAGMLLTLSAAPAADRGGAALAGHHLAARQPPDVLQHLAGKRCCARMCHVTVGVLPDSPACAHLAGRGDTD